MKIKIGINGVKGNMGKLLNSHLTNSEIVQIVATGNSSKELDQMLGQDIDTIVDLTSHDVVFENTSKIVEANIRPIIGTSGLTIEEVKLLQENCKNKSLGGIIAPNFSLGAMLMIKVAKDISTYFEDIEIIEMHRHDKKDKPSGTATKTQETILNQKNGKSHIPIHSIRLPGILAKQQVIFGSTGETLTIDHTSIDRKCFIPGMMMAIKEVMKLRHLVYGLESLL